MNYFAQIINNKVAEVTCINSDIADGAQFLHDLVGGEWVQTYMNSADKNYAGIAYTYDSEKQNFIAPQPYPSWTLDSKQRWQPPAPKPDGNYSWDESQLKWVLVS